MPTSLMTNLKWLTLISTTTVLPSAVTPFMSSILSPQLLPSSKQSNPRQGFGFGPLKYHLRVLKPSEKDYSQTAKRRSNRNSMTRNRLENNCQ